MQLLNCYPFLLLFFLFFFDDNCPDKMELGVVFAVVTRYDVISLLHRYSFRRLVSSLIGALLSLQGTYQISHLGVNHSVFWAELLWRDVFVRNTCYCVLREVFYEWCSVRGYVVMGVIEYTVLNCNFDILQSVYALKAEYRIRSSSDARLAEHDAFNLYDCFARFNL